MAKDIQAIIAAAVEAAVKAQGVPVAEPTKATAAPESKEAREAKKLALAKALPNTLDVAGQSAPLTFTGSRKGKEFTIHAVVAGVKVRVNGYVMPE